MEILKIITSLNNHSPNPPSPPPAPIPLASFSFFYLFPVKFKWNLIQQNSSVIFPALTINQGTKFETLKKPMFSLFDVMIFLFMG